jgi:hypothetical protein
LSVGRSEVLTIKEPTGVSLACTASIEISPVGMQTDTPPLELVKIIACVILFVLD